MFISFPVSCSIVSWREFFIVFRALHFVNKCSSPNCLFLQKGQCLRVGRMGVKLKL